MKTGLFNAEGKEMSLEEVVSMLPITNINRVEVIDESGRSYVNWKKENKSEIQIQDNGRTLKIFITKND